MSDRGAPAGPPSRATRRILGTLWGLVIVLSALLIVRVWVIPPYRIPTSSMQPTLLGDHEDGTETGDTVLVNKLAYLLSSPRRWDIVAFHAADDSDQSLVKRVVGLPGESIAIRGGEIYVNGEVVEKPEELRPIRYVNRGRFGHDEQVLGLDEYFVLGDYSYLSEDSRSWGPLQAERVFGRVIAILSPWERARSFPTLD